MNAQDLKNSILQRAIEGKLVPQRAEEGTAKELLQEIRAEKARLIKEKKIKKTKPLPPIADDEKPFDIPDSWEWVRFEDVADIASNLVNPLNYPDYQQIGPDLIEKDTGRLLGKRTVKENHVISGNHLFYKGQILYSKIRPALKKAVIAPYNGLCSADMYPINSWTDTQYLFFVMLSDFFTVQTQSKANRVKMPKINQDGLKAVILPLPPFDEQRRIVTKIEELLPDLTAYDKAQTELRTIEQHFPEDMKKSLLQYAIEGKLVPQRADEGTAKDLLREIQTEKARLIKDKKIKKTKPLPAITDDEKPFDLPESWEWVRLGNIGALVRGSGIKRSETTDNGKPCVRYGELYTTYHTRFSSAVSHTSDEVFDKSQKVHHNDILMSLTGENKWDIALAVVYEGTEEIAMGGDMTKWEYHGMNPLYLATILNSPYGISCKRNMATGDIIVHISNNKLSEILLPIPPLAEQKRIVARLEELLPLCQQLAAQP